MAGHPDELPALLQRSLRECGWTQADLAVRLGFSEKHVSEMFNGHAGLRLSTLWRIAELLDLTVVLNPMIK